MRADWRRTIRMEKQLDLPHELESLIVDQIAETIQSMNYAIATEIMDALKKDEDFIDIMSHLDYGEE